MELQHIYCTRMGAPITARVVQGIADALDDSTDVGRRICDWPDDPTADGLPLRIVGGLHALAQSGDAPELAAVFAGETSDASAVAEVVGRAFAAHGPAIQPYLDRPPQTNEMGRSGPLMLGLMQVVRRFGQPIELLEIGSSAGLNLLIDRLHYDLGGVETGPKDAPLTIRPEWQGIPPEPVEVRFASVRGVDVAPVDATDPASAARLRAYIWADNVERAARLNAGIALMRDHPVVVEQGDAADWVEARLAEPQAAGVTRVLMHSVVLQYLGKERRRRIESAMYAAGAKATAQRPLAWVVMEPHRSRKPRMEVWVQTWPGDGPKKLAHCQAHGAWIDTTCGDQEAPAFL
nr:DUF2332 domain-containing protein [Stakelama sediminis]